MTTSSETAPSPATERGHLVESPRALSESMLWRVQSAYYEDRSIRAWASGEIPYVLTTGPMLARADAQLIAAFADDVAAGRLGPWDPTEPIFVVELGAGTGRLGFEILWALERLRDLSIPVVYVLTDAVADNVAFWRAHPVLERFFASGALDVSRFRVGLDDHLELEVSGRSIGPGGLANPLGVVSNYLFDVLPQDAFESVDGALYEEHAGLYARRPGVDASTPDFLREIFVSPAKASVGRDRYEPELMDLLYAVAEEEAPNRRFLFPAQGVRGLRALAALSGGRILHMIGERPGSLPERTPTPEVVAAAIEADPEIPAGPGAIGAGSGEAFRPGALLAMGIHGGSMSLPVEVAILARSLASSGSELFLPPASPAGLLVCAVVAGAVADPVAFRAAFRRAVGDLGPEDVYLTVKAATDHGDTAPLAMLLATLRTGGCDPYLFKQMYAHLEKAAQGADEVAGIELERVLRAVYDHDYPLDDSTELAYPIGILLAQADRFEGAREFFLRSTARHGQRAATSFNLALCALHLEEVEAGLAALDEALALDPGYEPARALRTQVIEERDGPSRIR